VNSPALPLLLRVAQGQTPVDTGPRLHMAPARRRELRRRRLLAGSNIPKRERRRLLKRGLRTVMNRTGPLARP
jgi:hypothetical protein